MSRFNKAGEPTTQEVAEAVERLRDALFRAYGVEYMFIVEAKHRVIAQSIGSSILHAVVRR